MRFCYLPGRCFAFPLQIELLLRYRFTAEIQAALVCLCFFSSELFSVLETNKSRRGQGLGCIEGGTKIAF